MPWSRPNGGGVVWDAYAEHAEKSGSPLCSSGAVGTFVRTAKTKEKKYAMGTLDTTLEKIQLVLFIFRVFWLSPNVAS